MKKVILAGVLMMSSVSFAQTQDLASKTLSSYTQALNSKELRKCKSHGMTEAALMAVRILPDYCTKFLRSTQVTLVQTENALLSRLESASSVEAEDDIRHLIKGVQATRQIHEQLTEGLTVANAKYRVSTLEERMQQDVKFIKSFILSN